MSFVIIEPFKMYLAYWNGNGDFQLVEIKPSDPINYVGGFEH